MSKDIISIKIRGTLAYEDGTANALIDVSELNRQGYFKDAWQPIETAPKDGSHVLLYRPQIRFVGYWAIDAQKWIISAPRLPTMNPAPTFWQPLPELPKQ